MYLLISNSTHLNLRQSILFILSSNKFYKLFSFKPLTSCSTVF
ncbi:unnamed protein product [Schistosoma curassoni]|uniref:Uncharacterized protein n=1 Tax=Schistosoma curassoni TaxID=6186 RepID=A0A183JLW0_9TREM|nr:unnamed protein product [Schistosoma curassoni]